MPDDENDVVEECTTWGMFIELRYIYPGLPIATDNERIAYDVYSFCGMIDSDGMGCLLSQPQSKRQLLFQSLLNLGLAEQVENATNAASALQNSGLSLEGNDDREATSKLLRPFEDRYYRDLREPTYSRLLEFIHSSEEFLFYARVAQHCQQEGLNIFDPKVWESYR